MKTRLNLQAAWLAAAMISFVASAADEFAIGPVLARAKGVEIRRSQLDDAFVAYRANLAARGQSIPESRREPTEAQLLDRMIVTQLLVNKATAADREHARTNTTKFLAESRKMANTEADFVRHLRSLGMTLAQFTNRVVEQAVSEEVITREVKSKITIPEVDLQKFWETNDTAFRQFETARASHILFATKDFSTGAELSDADKAKKKTIAESVLERARKGEDFTNLVAFYSEDPRAKENLGEYKFTRAKDEPRGAMVPEFENMAFSLQTNQIGELVKTVVGYHIIKLHEIIPARKEPLAEARARIQDFLMQAALEKAMPAYFEKVKKEFNVEITDEKLKAAMEKADKEREEGAKAPAPAR